MKKLVVYIVLLSVALMTAGCGGGGGAATSINVTMTDFQFTPDTFTVTAGKDISIQAINTGSVVHNFVIMKLGTTAGGSFDDQDIPNVFWQVEVQPGSTANDTFTAPTEPGSYQVVCKTPGHLESGMIATLNVQAAQ